MADGSGAHTRLEVGEEHRGDPINRPDVRARAWAGEKIKEPIQETVV